MTAIRLVAARIMVVGSIPSIVPSVRRESYDTLGSASDYLGVRVAV
jgi:hypothetical protein